MRDPTPRRRFAQHFLRDEAVVERILLALAPRPGDAVVEIGPGTGVLTRALLARLPELDVIEIDRDLAAALPARLGHPAGLRVHAGDALSFELDSLPARSRLRIVGNLPYNVSTPLVFRLLAQRALIADMHFMLQKELVARIVAGPGGKDYGRLSVMTQLHCDASHLFDVPPGAFSPPPKVHSALVRLTVHPGERADLLEESALGEVVLHAFSQRRKTLRNALRGLLEAAQIEAAGVDPAARAETLDLVAFVRLGNQLSGARARAAEVTHKSCG